MFNTNVGIFSQSKYTPCTIISSLVSVLFVHLSLYFIFKFIILSLFIFCYNIQLFVELCVGKIVYLKFHKGYYRANSLQSVLYSYNKALFVVRVFNYMNKAYFVGNTASDFSLIAKQSLMCVSECTDWSITSANTRFDTGLLLRWLTYLDKSCQYHRNPSPCTTIKSIVGCIQTTSNYTWVTLFCAYRLLMTCTTHVEYKS